MSALPAEKEPPRAANEDAPHPAHEPTPWALHVLTGAQKGAEIILEPTRYKIGSDPSCDIVLTAEGVAPIHAELFFADKRLSILRLHAPIETEGEMIETAPFDLKSETPLAIGGCLIAYGEADGIWPEPPEPQEEKEGEGEGETSPDAKEEGLAATPLQTGVAASPMRIPPPLARFGAKALPWVLLIFASALLLEMVNLSWRMGPGEHEISETINVTRSPQEILREEIGKDSAFAHLLLEESPDAPLLIRGYVEKTADLNRLRSRAGRAAALVKVKSLEHIGRALHVLLPLYGSQLSYDIRAESSGFVSVRVRGLVRERGNLVSLKEALRRDLPDVDEVETNVLTLEEALAQLRDMIAPRRAFGGLSIRREGDIFVIAGNILENFRPQWDEVAQELNHAMPAGISPDLRIRFGPRFAPNLRSLLISPRSRRVRLGAPPRPYGEGSALPQGFTLKKIERDALILVRGDAEYIYPLPAIP